MSDRFPCIAIERAKRRTKQKRGSKSWNRDRSVTEEKINVTENRPVFSDKRWKIKAAADNSRRDLKTDSEKSEAVGNGEVTDNTGQGRKRDTGYAQLSSEKFRKGKKQTETGSEKLIIEREKRLLKELGRVINEASV